MDFCIFFLLRSHREPVNLILKYYSPFKHFRSPLSTEISKHCVFSDVTQSRALPAHKREDWRRVGIELATAVCSRTLIPCDEDLAAGDVTKASNSSKLL